MQRYKTFADALESEVLTEMAGTFFGARKSMDDLVEDFHLHVEELRSLEALVFSRVLYLRSLLLGVQGEAALFREIGVAAPFAEVRAHSGSRTWRPDSLPFAFRRSTRFFRAVMQAYGEVRKACEAYMHGEYIDDPNHSGRKRLSLHYRLLERLCARLNERMERLNRDNQPSSVLQYARDIHYADQPGQGTLMNSLGAESLDKGLMFQKIDFEALKLWKAPDLPKPEACEALVQRFCAAFYEAHAEQIARVLEELA